MSESGSADAVAINIENDIVADRQPCRHMVESEAVTHSPCDIMVCAGGVATHSECADQITIRIVERQATSEYVHAPDALPHHRIVAGAELLRIAAVGDGWVYRVAVL